MVNSKDVFIWNTIEILSDFGKNHNEKLLIPEVLNLAELYLVIPETKTKAIILGNETHSKLFSEVQRLGIY